MLEREEAEEAGQPYLLAVDNAMVVPVGANVAVQVTAQGVLHSFAMPSFGIKTDAVPGRLNETWFRADREGIYLRAVLGAVRVRGMPSCRLRSVW